MNLTEDSRSSGVTCGACGEFACDFAGTIPFYLKTGEKDTPLWRCDRCGTYSRDADFDDPLLRSHFDVASYTNVSAEARLRSSRSDLFRQILGQIQQHCGGSLKGTRILDIGSAFGHFLEVLGAAGAHPEGVEIAAGPRELARERGLIVHTTVDSLMPRTYDIVTAIDSLYYANHPVVLLGRIQELLTVDGIFVMRLANRAWFLDTLRILGVMIDRDHFGDAKYNFSLSGASALLDRAGFEIESVHWAETGKRDGRRLMRLYYLISGLISEHLSVCISPGMLIVARPSGPEISTASS